MIKCIDGKFGYDGRPVISDLNFEVSAGDYLCIVGENGSGKSTLLKGILGLKAPMSGNLYCSFKNTGLGYLPQKTETQKDFPAGVFEVVISGRLNKMGRRLFYSREDRKCAEESMKKLGISDLKSKSFQELSGGQQQRVLLARALCSAEKIIVLDEPVSGLDPKVTEEMYRILKGLNDEGMTVVMVSHDINRSVRCATHILHLGQKQVFFGNVAEYIKSDACRCFCGGNHHG